jgi:hypothetical protein
MAPVADRLVEKCVAKTMTGIGTEEIALTAACGLKQSVDPFNRREISLNGLDGASTQEPGTGIEEGRVGYHQ